MIRHALLILIGLSVSWGQTPSASQLGPAQRQRIHRLQESLMAPCCWAEPVSVHRSETANEMRVEIERSVAQGLSDRDILDHYKGIYGARILTEPEGPAQLWIYFVPALASVAGLTLVILMLRRIRAPQTPGELA